MDDAALEGSRDRFGAVNDFEFPEYALKMIFGGVVADVEDIGDFLVGETFREVLQDLDFTRSQVLKHFA